MNDSIHENNNNTYKKSYSITQKITLNEWVVNIEIKNLNLTIKTLHIEHT